ncbi:uncharacterized protein BJX67DRAFT_107765 [Aspergillus lucknowensis]|uniref:Uncharacterized protein n=1 Tax=Aspergillus lucknowensis TaxID=176173 RepID=A0ABR4LRN2_9EURO
MSDFNFFFHLGPRRVFISILDLSCLHYVRGIANGVSLEGICLLKFFGRYRLCASSLMGAVLQSKRECPPSTAIKNVQGFCATSRSEPDPSTRMSQTRAGRRRRGISPQNKRNKERKRLNARLNLPKLYFIMGRRYRQGIMRLMGGCGALGASSAPFACSTASLKQDHASNHNHAGGRKTAGKNT